MWEGNAPHIDGIAVAGAGLFFELKSESAGPPAAWHDWFPLAIPRPCQNRQVLGNQINSPRGSPLCVGSLAVLWHFIIFHIDIS